MFRRLSNNLPQDANYPSDLRQLGLFINSAHQLKHSDYPEDAYRFSVTTNDRYNDVREEAVNICIRDELVTRLSSLGIKRLWLPALTNEIPSASTRPTMPILATELKALQKAERVVVVVSSLMQDLGVWDWKSTRGEAGIEAGTVISFVKDLLSRAFARKGDDVNGVEQSLDGLAAGSTAFVMPNPGQLLYSYRHKRAMTLDSWNALPRPSALHMPPLIDEQMNRVAGSETAEKHLKYVFDNILANEAFIARKAEVFLVGLNEGADQLLTLLEESCKSSLLLCWPN